ncbi:MAG: hypothetical protein UW68_C0001G0048 [Candidatus Collierbacteria bacterium GW2011_GWB1_44_6]|uniref:SCP domain-containing protein n=2 Tax=Candidatus Collieribacteriota TaxID=1752725 RepID=A0A0G1LYD8_9BACT|nr:MAG: hypothetical protein UV68_C0001G0020 [Candidatus Collierbacteria bacterium GW2011_GWC2_43_12]KKT73852.1 MAG: hypothetical protein UW68_C0001G0048 [Candidatus Collierbacteria bacterium GW2011_GWB1_44_6]KKT84140.1 MAG: hypothetical protein UW80_C0001G0020 [Microgenomates group bacterium GW2011_GWC1_44_9]
MKIFLRFLLWVLAIGIIFYGFKNIPIKKIGEEIGQKIYVERNGVKFFPDWTTETLLSEINEARESEGLMRVTVNEKLNRAALSRLAVIITEDDYSGAVTGLTREVAVKNAGYNANLIGDLLLLDFFKTNDAIENWFSSETTKATLLHTDFKEVGIAVKNEDDTVSAYIILVSPAKKIATAPTKTVWGGPELWEVVNKRRVELGVNPLGKRDELCTLASIRLNQLLELGKLDGHAGFVPLLERSDLKWISEKYNISEFLAAGYATPQETVKAWETTLGHRALLAGGEYVWGCIYAQNTFAVAVAAY